MKTIIKGEENKDGLGTAGFITSLVGFFAPYGLIGLVGLILSAASMKNKRNGMNTAGVVIGTIGTAIKLLLWIFIFSVVGMGL